ncbi:MAG: ABC transporter ATP-binding protein [Chthonomonadales bacterium]|nr:ABC transporter ATP-binding protein [Chthonomonadales bacterium]
MQDRGFRDATLTLEGVSHRYGRRVTFAGVGATVRTGQSLVVTGPNGSGKSTLLRLVCGLLRPSSGTVRVAVGGVEVDGAARRMALGYVAPDLTLYPELTGVENLSFFARLRGLAPTRADLAEILERVGLLGRGREIVRGYSSGMRQRLRYAFALMHRPPVLVLDEPTANLDQSGVAMVEEVVRCQRSEGLLIVATNEAREVGWGDVLVRLGRG